MDAPAPTPVPPPTPPPKTVVDVFTGPVQAGLFVILLGLVGFVAWNSFRPDVRPAVNESATRTCRIDLNRADRGELMLLPGIGPQLAERILEHRESHGPFEGLADLRKIPGIGPISLEKLRPRVQLSWPELPAVKSEAASLVVLPAKMSNKSAKTPTDPIDLNRASLADLQRLPGIGPKLAQRIVDARESRPFASIGDVRRVPGIGVKTLEKIKPFIAVAATD